MVIELDYYASLRVISKQDSTLTCNLSCFLFVVFVTRSRLRSIFQCSSTPQLTIDSLNSFQILFH